jgi:hypothetical protein
MSENAPPLDAEHAAFIEGPVSITAASRNARNETTLSRVFGCRVSADRRRVTVFLSAAQSAALLADLRGNGTIAVVFSRPSTHRTIQLKGSDATVVPMTGEDPRLLAAYSRQWAAEIRPLGFSKEFAGILAPLAPGDVVAVAFTPAAAFLQTPGPKAGTALRGDS